MEKYITIIIEENGSVEFADEVTDTEKITIVSKWFEKRVDSKGCIVFHTNKKESLRPSAVETLPFLQTNQCSYVVIQSAEFSSYSYICTKKGEEQSVCDKQKVRLVNIYKEESKANQITEMLNNARFKL